MKRVMQAVRQMMVALLVWGEMANEMEVAAARATVYVARDGRGRVVSSR